MTDWLDVAPRVRPVNSDQWDAVPIWWLQENAEPKVPTS